LTSERSASQLRTLASIRERILEQALLGLHEPTGPDPSRPQRLQQCGDAGGTTQSINGRGFAIFLFVQMLKRPWRVDETPYPKKRTRLPVIQPG
jgi:hypothetical protein